MVNRNTTWCCKKNKLKLLFFFFISTFLISFLKAQEKSALFVIGFEAGGISKPLFGSGETDFGNKRITGGITFEIPLKSKFSFGTGIIYSDFGGINTYEKSGITRLTSGDVLETEILKSDIRLSYYAIPLRVIYRLKCNCIYAQIGIQPEFYISDFNNYNYQHFFTDKPEAYSDYTAATIRNPNWTLDFGIGFKAHFKENFRLIFRPSYTKFLNPFFENDKVSSGSSLRMVFGLQYAFLRGTE